MKQKVLFLVGPTGSGKSELALLLAKKLKGEIISCDAMQVYKGMDIGTAKPALPEQREVPHHLINLISTRSEYSVFKHRALALKTINSIFKNKKIPILVGGSGLYVRAIIDGLAPQPGKQPLRKEFEAFVKKESVSSLYERLQKLDPMRAAKIHPNDQKRIIRALEIIESSGRSQSDWERETKGGLKSLGIEPVVFGIFRERKELYDRIEKRVDQMIENGWLKEVKRLHRKGFSKTAKTAIGYYELLDYLRGHRTLEEAISQIKQRTRNLAKRQMTWFRRDKNIHWLPISNKESFKSAVTLMAKEFK